MTQSIIHKTLIFTEGIFNKIEGYWESRYNYRISGNIIVLAFLISLVIIQLNLWGALPAAVSSIIPKNHFAAIQLAFTLLLMVEIVSLVLTLPRSVSSSMLKQFEILSLILLRQAFKEFGEFPDPVDWTKMAKPVFHVMSDAGGALVLFLFIVLIARFQRHKRITKTAEEQFRFVKVKKFVAILLMFFLIAFGIFDLILYLRHDQPFDYFQTFYTVLIFSDILIVLVSLRYSYSYPVVFRNSGFALATVIIRLALSAPPYINALLGITAAIFVFVLVLIYNGLSFKDQDIKATNVSKEP